MVRARLKSADTAMNRDVYYETITPSHRGLVMRHVARGDRIFVYDFTYRLKTIPWLAPLIDAGAVERIYVHPFSRADHEAIRAVEWLHPRVTRHRLVRVLENVFGSAEVETVLKKALVEAVFPYLFIRLDLDDRTGGDREVLLVPDTYEDSERALAGWPARPATLRGVRIPRLHAMWSRWAGRLARRRQTDRLLASALLTLVRGRFGGGRRAERAARRGFDHVYAIDQPFQTKFEGGRRFDFFIDGELLTRKNTAFLVSDGADGAWAREAGERGYEIVRRRDYAGLPQAHDGESSPNRGPIARLLASTFLAVGAPEWLRQAAATAGLVVATDAPLLERVSLRNYLYTNQDTVLQGWRNALLRRHGAQSWCFTLAIGGGYLYTAGAESEHRYWAYQSPNHFVTASAQLVEYHRRHCQRVDAYHDVGNIWSELALDVERHVGRDTLRAQWFGPRAVDGRIVGWFDTSFVQADTSPSTYDEALAWYGDLERFLVEFPDVLVVVKPSKSDDYFTDMRTQWADARGGALMQIWRRLREHPRVVFPGHQGDPTSIIAGSDLTITYCFSSISAEALGAGRRAIWFEPGARWRDTLYGRVPGLVAHGYDELVARARALLFEVSHDDYRAYLDRHVRGVVEDFLDGRGLTRFRQLLEASARSRCA